MASDYVINAFTGRLDKVGSGGAAGAPANSIQFNNPLGTFDGSADLTFVDGEGLTNLQHTALGNGATIDPSVAVAVSENFTGDLSGGPQVAGSFFAGILTDPSSSNNVVRGLQGGVFIDGVVTETFDEITGMDFSIENLGSGNVERVAAFKSTVSNDIATYEDLIGFNAQVFTGNASGEAITGALVRIENGGTGTAQSMIGLDVVNVNENGGTVTSNIGVNVQEMVGGVDNWAIKTGLGLVEFGDRISQILTSIDENAYTSDITFDPSDDDTNYRAFLINLNSTTTRPVTQYIAIAGYPAYNGTGTIDQAVGMDFGFANNGVGDIVHAVGTRLEIDNLSTGDITNAYGNWILSALNAGGGTITNNYGLKIDDQTAGTNDWAIKTGLGDIDFGDKIKQYNAIDTVGWGVPAIYGSGRVTAQTAAVGSVAAYTVGAADGSFLISSNVNITTFAVGTFNVQVDYTDETNTARTLTLNFSNLTGTIGVALAAVGPFEGLPAHLRCKASTAITVKTTGTFTSLTYNAEGAITQIS